MGASTGAVCRPDEDILSCERSSCIASCPSSSGLKSLGEQECADIGLVLATTRGELAGVRRALMMGANPDTTMDLRLKLGDTAPKRCMNSSMTPLMRACELGHEEAAIILLDAKACIDYTDPDGWTPLCHALANGEIGCARLLASRMNRERLKTHVDLVHDLQEELLELCSVNAGPEAVSTLVKELAPSGLFARETPQDVEDGALAPHVPVPKAAAEDRGPELVARAAKSMVVPGDPMGEARELVVRRERIEAALPMEDAAYLSREFPHILPVMGRI